MALRGTQRISNRTMRSALDCMGSLFLGPTIDRDRAADVNEQRCCQEEAVSINAAWLHGLNVTDTLKETFANYVNISVRSLTEPASVKTHLVRLITSVDRNIEFPSCACVAHRLCFC